MSDYFEKYGDRTVPLAEECFDGEKVFKESGSLEDMYQAFKARMYKEITEEINGNSNR